ncbi:MAG: hypothetical protein LBF54_02140 [Holosporaceae bacterium]|nr:hypothetical protein [Holosporaceae bacterium]
MKKTIIGVLGASAIVISANGMYHRLDMSRCLLELRDIGQVIADGDLARQPEWNIVSKFGAEDLTWQYCSPEQRKILVTVDPEYRVAESALQHVFNVGAPYVKEQFGGDDGIAMHHLQNLVLRSANPHFGFEMDGERYTPAALIRRKVAITGDYKAGKSMNYILNKWGSYAHCAEGTTNNYLSEDALKLFEEYANWLDRQ